MITRTLLITLSCCGLQMCTTTRLPELTLGGRSQGWGFEIGHTWHF